VPYSVGLWTYFITRNFRGDRKAVPYSYDSAHPAKDHPSSTCSLGQVAKPFVVCTMLVHWCTLCESHARSN